MLENINIDELIDFYYYTVGYSNDDEAECVAVKNVLSYLIDCGFSKDKIVPIIEECGTNLSFDNLPESLWQQSLLKKDCFYIHKELRLFTQSTVVDIFSDNIVASDHAIEMKIQYTYDDILNYYVEAFDIDINVLNYKKEIASFKYIYELCEKQYSNLNAIDIIMFLIDNAANSSNNKIYNVLDLQQYLYDTIIYLNGVNNELLYSHNNKIVWRK